MTFVSREPIKVVADIMAHELPLAVGYIMLNDEKWNIPKSYDGIFMVLSYLGPNKVIANTNKFDPATDEEVQSTTVLEVIQIDFMSYGPAARARKEEVAMALGSMYSQQWQEKYGCQIARQPEPFVDTSNLEGAGMLKRFTTRISVTSIFMKSKAAEYYTTFPTPEVKYNV